MKHLMLHIPATLLIFYPGYSTQGFFTPHHLTSSAPLHKQRVPSRAPEADVHLVTLPLKFKGEVRRGQVFERSIDRRLTFRLNPDEYGWEIWIGDKTKPDRNYCAIITPPYHGINALDIEGWHFRSSDNSASVEARGNNVNAPQEIRRFFFVLNEAGYLKASHALQRLLWPYSYTASETEEAREAYDRIKKMTGRLRIRSKELGNLKGGGRAWIERMRFEVEIGSALADSD